jgi:hypothetical protein
MLFQSIHFRFAAHTSRIITEETILKVCKIRDSHSGTQKQSSLLVCYTVSTGIVTGVSEGYIASTVRDKQFKNKHNALI